MSPRLREFVGVAEVVLSIGLAVTALRYSLDNEYAHATFDMLLSYIVGKNGGQRLKMEADA